MMDFDRVQQILEALQAQCPSTAPHEIDAWTSVITRAREALVVQQIKEDEATSATAHGRLNRCPRSASNRPSKAGATSSAPCSLIGFPDGGD
jgi:hypothetical protein